MVRRADVELRLPADGGYASVLRSSTVGLAARVGLTLDQIEDLRVAVGEAAAMALAEADPGSDLLCRFHLDPGQLSVSVVVSTPPGSASLGSAGPGSASLGSAGRGSASLGSAGPVSPSPRADFGWRAITALTTSADAERGDGRLTVRLTVRQTVRAAPEPSAVRT